MLKLIKKALIFIGKPFYYAISVLVIAILTFLYFLGHTILRISNALSKLPKIRISFVFLKVFLRRLARIKFRPLFVFILFVLFSFVIYFYLTILRGLPSPKKILNINLEVSTKIYDRNGILLYKIFKDENRTPIALSQIPMHVQLATLAAEDAEFYSHPGFSIKGIFRSLIRNIKEGEVSGGSTITQQLVKNALLTPEKTLIRKIKEIILAIEVERVLTKDQILEMYLNEVSYGGTAYGIKEAASEYFDKNVDELTLSEAAFLAGLIKSPTKLSPYGSNPNLAFEREEEILHLMKVNKYITPQQQEEALKEKIVVKTKRTDIKAPHFVMYIRGLLVDKFGEETVEKGGLEVTTSLDYPTQKIAEMVVSDEIEKLRNLRVGNGAALVLNPQTGEILAMVGSKDYFDPNGGNVNVTIRPRQPGSSIKVVNYAYALSHGFTPITTLDDSPVVFNVPGQPPYVPTNYDGAFRGKLPLRSALAESRNIPAVKVLASYGVAKMIEQGIKMGITTWDNTSRFGLSLTLGGGEVKLLDLAQVYATVANYGQKPEITPILKITDYKGRVLEEVVPLDSARGKQVLDPRVAYILIDILKDNYARSPAFGLNSYLVVPNHPEVAVKTGTSNNLKDNLTLGFNQKYLTAVWVGNNDGSSMSRIASGLTGASPIWNKIMRSLLQNEESKTWETPPGLVQIKICSGRFEWFLQENTPTITCNPSPTPAPLGKDKILEGASTQRD